MQQKTILKIREVKKVYKSALCSPCKFHIAPLKTSLVNELEKISDKTPLAQYRIDQLIKKIQNL